MKLFRLVTVLIILGAAWVSANSVSGADEDGIALAIIFDTSGSMNDPVKDENGNPAPKFRIADRALVTIVDRIQNYATNDAAGAPRKIQTELVTFQKGEPHIAMPLASFDAEALKSWARSFSSPDGGTPLGNSLTTASRALLQSGLKHKHVLIITDGANTVGQDPAVVLAKLQQTAIQKQTSISVHFVAFDVDDKVFNGVKKLGATVVTASNENQLNAQLEFILERKILLEEEETPQPPKKP